MVFLIVLAALVVWALAATVFVVIRDGYSPVATRTDGEARML